MPVETSSDGQTAALIRQGAGEEGEGDVIRGTPWPSHTTTTLTHARRNLHTDTTETLSTTKTVSPIVVGGGGKGWGVCICVIICWASFEIKGLCPVLNKNELCFMPVHTCVAECAWNVGYTRHFGASVFEDVPLVEFMYLVPCERHACYVRVTVGDSGLCCICVTSFERQLTPLCVDWAVLEFR